MGKKFKGRIICKGTASGSVLKSDVPMGFFGHIEPDSGVYKESGHPFDGESVKDRILVFPRGKGSTVGSYILYGLKKAGNAPAALLMSECDTIVAVGAIISGIPTVDGLELSELADGTRLRVADGEVSVEEG